MKLAVTLTLTCFAQVGIANSLSAFLQLNELSDEEMEEDDLLREGRCTAWENLALFLMLKTLALISKSFQAEIPMW